MNLADHIEKIAKKSEDSHMAFAKMKGLSSNINQLKNFLNCSQEQAFIFALIFYLTLENGETDYNEIAKHLDIPAMRLLKYKNDIEWLVKSRLLRQENNNTMFKARGISFYVPSHVIDGLLKNRKSFSMVKIKDCYDFIIRVIEMIEVAKDDSGSIEILKEDFMNLCHENDELNIAKKLINSSIPEHEIMILIFVTYKLMDGEVDISLSEASEFMESVKSLKLKVRRSFLNGQNRLIKRGFIETKSGFFRSDNELNVTEKGLQFLLGEEAEKLIIQSDKNKNEINFEKIASVKLYLNANEKKQLNTLEGIFETKKFDKITQRMKNNQMKAGFTVLFYGSPGTGKTESVYQLARKTGRSIIPVEISKTKSMWFGESEKLIKKVFENYRKIRESKKLFPILLFNEADGIFNKRTKNVDSPVSQTLNAIQNIILQEMEDFEGIMVATTNLTDNLDKAFERRFLYKVKFEIPEHITRTKIMMDKLPFLKSENVSTLCEKYSLSGGQIANIAKKCNIHELLNGRIPKTIEIEQFCRDEQGFHDRKKLGF
ncbi:MAG: AAA family ATPase [Bacteroidales bacterium]|nr:AAA family ATPase [Bacteroidales bacterium]